MGATEFLTEQEGSSMGEAFLRAVEDAHYWHGHSGYTGTIAEKPGAETFHVPVTALTDEPDTSVPQRVALAMAWWYYASIGTGGETVDPFQQPPEPAEWTQRARRDAQTLSERMGISTWKRMCDLYHEKWSEAVAFEVDKGRWVFCGLASC